MAYLERTAMVRISSITTSPTALTTATLLPVTPLSYSHNSNMVQEEGRLAFTQLMTTRRVAGTYDGLFAHAIRTTEYATTVANSLPSEYRAGFERPMAIGTSVDCSELSCSYVSESADSDVGIQTMTSSFYNENVVDNSILVEVS
jgi:hypothetical protein